MTAVIDVTSWAREDSEAMGARDKIWLLDGKQRWLFKEPRAHGLYEPRADLWAELVAWRVARLLGTPAAEARPAVLDGARGVISCSVGGPLVHGNELLATRNPEYDTARKGAVDGYDLASIEQVLVGYSGSEAGFTAYESFVGYLVFDAVVGNTDRHHENWAVIGGVRSLSPSYDHGVSLGYNATAADRSQVGRFAGRGRARHFPGRPTLVDLALDALDRIPVNVGAELSRRVRALDLTEVASAVADIPDGWMSEGARTFVVDFIRTNQGRLTR